MHENVEGEIEDSKRKEQNVPELSLRDTLFEAADKKKILSRSVRKTPRKHIRKSDKRVARNRKNRPHLAHILMSITVLKGKT